MTSPATSRTLRTGSSVVAERREETVEDLKLDVRAVLAEIGAEEAVAQLEARIEEFEQQFGRIEQRGQESERARKGELDVMRARVSDALQVVQDAVEEQREAWTNLESRLASLAADTESNAAAAIDALREELTPRVHRALLQSDEVQARVAGELESVASELRSRLETHREQIAEAKTEAEQRVASVEAELRDEHEQRTAAFAELESRTQAQVGEVEATVTQQHGELVERLDGLRRELDATTGELRAGWNLRAQELEDSVVQAHDSLAETIEAQGEASAELERRWIEGTRDIARRIEEVTAHARELVNAEKVGREQSVHELSTELEAIGSAIAGLEDTLGAAETKRVTEGEQLRRNLQETSGRLEVLQQKVANAVGKIASELTNKVSSVTGELEALREASVRQEQRLTTLDAVVKRVDGLEAQQGVIANKLTTATDNARFGELQKAMSALRQDLSTLAGGVEASVEQSSQVRQQLTTAQETLREHVALRQEVRELAARMAESAARLDETERLARAAGQAIAGAVRKAREASVRPAVPLAPANPGQPSVPAAEQAPLFQNRTAVPRRAEVTIDAAIEAAEAEEERAAAGGPQQPQAPPPSA